MGEKWREIYTENQIKKIQEIELINLKELIRVCNIIGVEFFLYGGSLIGAIRHKGFIPWDDDLDVAMLRKDYMKFIELAPKLLNSEFYLQSPYNDTRSPYFYTKLRLKGTKCIEYTHHKLNIEKGIYVDIYPIDQLPNNEEDYLNQFKKYKKWVSRFCLRQSPFRGSASNSLKNKLKAIIKFIISISLHILPHKLYVTKLDKIMTAYNGKDTRRLGNYSYPRPVNFFNAIQPFEKGRFENFDINLPKDWENHLKRRYGDYMQMPPEENRIGHKPFLLDFGKYQEIGRFTNEKEIFKD